MDSEEAKVVDLHNRSSNAHYDRLRQLRRYQALLAARPATGPAPAGVVNDAVTAVDVAALDAARAAEADLPWQIDPLDRYRIADQYGNGVTSTYRSADAALIVAAVNALPELLAEVRRGRALREAVEAVAEEHERAYMSVDPILLRAALAGADGGQ